MTRQTSSRPSRPELLALRVRKDQAGHHAPVGRVNLKLALSVRLDEIALLDQRNQGCPGISAL